MIVSSRGAGGLWHGRGERPAVAQRCPEGIDQAAGEREQGLGADPEGTVPTSSSPATFHDDRITTRP